MPRFSLFSHVILNGYCANTSYLFDDPTIRKIFSMLIRNELIKKNVLIKFINLFMMRKIWLSKESKERMNESKIKIKTGK